MGVIPEEQKPPDLEAMRARALDFFGLYHPTAGPCRCGSCNPVAHSDHPLHTAMSEVRRDHNALLAEVERLREVLRAAVPDAIDRMFIDALPGATERYLASKP